MVNTFVPFADIEACARALDYRRLGKQRVEAYQLWRALTGRGKLLPDGTEGPPTKGWVNHPATLMWKGHACFLAMYCNAMIDEWVARGYRNNMARLPHCGKPSPPWWWGWEPIHMSHRASLNRKKPEYYHFEVGEYQNWGYVWPSKVDRKISEPPIEKVCEPLMELKELRKSKQVDDLVRKNFGPNEDLWSPKCFDILLGLRERSKLLGLCSLQMTPGGYWILGDLCTAEHGKGYGSELVRQVLLVTSGPIWADATCPASEQILIKNGFCPTNIQPWDGVVKGYMRLYIR